jgi:hypothetical protein
MSVALYNTDELEGLWYALEPDGDEDSEVRAALLALAYANRAAFLLSYGWEHGDELARIMQFDLRAPRPYDGWRGTTPDGQDDVVAWAQNLLYNCVSNGGADFAPSTHAVKLVQAAGRRKFALRREVGR